MYVDDFYHASDLNHIIIPFYMIVSSIEAPIAQLVSALDLVTSSVQVEGSILTAGKRLSLKNLNVIIRAIN